MDLWNLIICYWFYITLGEPVIIIKSGLESINEGDCDRPSTTIL